MKWLFVLVVAAALGVRADDDFQRGGTGLGQGGFQNQQQQQQGYNPFGDDFNRFAGGINNDDDDDDNNGHRQHFIQGQQGGALGGVREGKSLGGFDSSGENRFHQGNFGNQGGNQGWTPVPIPAVRPTAGGYQGQGQGQGQVHIGRPVIPKGPVPTVNDVYQQEYNLGNIPRPLGPVGGIGKDSSEEIRQSGPGYNGGRQGHFGGGHGRGNVHGVGAGYQGQGNQGQSLRGFAKATAFQGQIGQGQIYAGGNQGQRQIGGGSGYQGQGGFQGQKQIGGGAGYQGQGLRGLNQISGEAGYQGQGQINPGYQGQGQGQLTIAKGGYQGQGQINPGYQGQGQGQGQLTIAKGGYQGQGFRGLNQISGGAGYQGQGQISTGYQGQGQLTIAKGGYQGQGQANAGYQGQGQGQLTIAKGGYQGPVQRPVQGQYNQQLGGGFDSDEQDLGNFGQGYQVQQGQNAGSGSGFGGQYASGSGAFVQQRRPIVPILSQDFTRNNNGYNYYVNGVLNLKKATQPGTGSRGRRPQGSPTYVAGASSSTGARAKATGVNKGLTILPLSKSRENIHTFLPKGIPSLLGTKQMKMVSEPLVITCQHPHRCLLLWLKPHSDTSKRTRKHSQGPQAYPTAG